MASGQLIRIPFGSGAITLLDITVFLFSVAGLIKLKFKLQKPPLPVFAALLFIVIAIISLALTPLSLQVGEYVNAFSYTLRFSLYVLFAWIIFSGVFNFAKNINKTFLIAGTSFAALGLLQFIFYPNLDFLVSLGWDPHFYRTVSTFLDPNFAGAFLILTLLQLLSLRAPRSGAWQSYLLFSLVYVALLTTFSRSSYLMFLVSGSVLSFFQKSKKLLILTIILFLILMGGFKIYTQLVAKPRNIDRTQSASFRLNTWQQGLTLLQKYPVFGVGFNAYRYGLKQLNLGDEQFLQSHGSSGNDSSLLFVAATTGLLGLAAYLYFLFSIFKYTWKTNKIVSAGLAGLIIHSFFANSLFYTPILAWVLFISSTPKK